MEFTFLWRAEAHANAKIHEMLVLISTKEKNSVRKGGRSEKRKQGAILGKVNRKDVPEKVTSEQRHEGGEGYLEEELSK